MMGSFLFVLGGLFGAVALLGVVGGATAFGQLLAALIGLAGAILFASAFVVTAIDRLRNTVVELAKRTVPTDS